MYFGQSTSKLYMGGQYTFDIMREYLIGWFGG